MLARPVQKRIDDGSDRVRRHLAFTRLGHQFVVASNGRRGPVRDCGAAPRFARTTGVATSKTTALEP